RARRPPAPRHRRPQAARAAAHTRGPRPPAARERPAARRPAVIARLVALGVIASCGGPRYLGAPLPAACAARDAEGCAAWLAERELGAGALDVYDDRALRMYVQDVADRL